MVFSVSLLRNHVNQQTKISLKLWRQYNEERSRGFLKVVHSGNIISQVPSWKHGGRSLKDQTKI